MKYSLLQFTILIVLTTSCKPKESSNDLRTAANKEHFDNWVFQNIESYTALKDLTLKHYDTLFKFRNKNLLVTHYDESGKRSESSGYESWVTFTFDFKKDNFLDYDNEEIIPSNLRQSFSQAVKKIGNNNIAYWTLDKDSIVEIQLRGKYDPISNIEIGHSIVWKRRYSNPNPPETSITLDSTITADWTYYIDVDYRPE